MTRASCGRRSGFRRALRAALLLAALLASGGAPGVAGAEAVLRFAYVTQAGDSYFEPVTAYTGLVLEDREPAAAGARAALRESRILGRATGLGFELVEAELTAGQPAGATAAALADGGVSVVLLDLPRAPALALAEALLAEGLLPINVRLPDDDLRGEDCLPGLLHSAASRAMLADGLAQHLARKGWRRILFLVGEDPDDAPALAAARASAAKFGLDVVDVRRFVLGNDPRRRAERNVALMTGDGAYDVVWVVDGYGEFGRYVPFDTHDPRPVVGAVGLVPHAWHRAWERHGAPQLNQRFRKLAGRDMADNDYAAWIAVKAAIEAAVRTGSTDTARIAAFLRSDALNLDTYKGAIGSFRDWNGQLRQPILLATHDAVIARAPLDGFLHQSNTLDTLGADRPESRCRQAR